MNSPEHIKLAYCRYLAQREEEMQKEAQFLGPKALTFAKAMGSRMMDSARAVPRDFSLPFKLFSKDPNKFRTAIDADTYMHTGGGSIMRPFATNMGASGRRFDQFANMDDATFNTVLSQKAKTLNLPFAGEVRNPFQNRDAYWLAGLDDAGRDALTKGRAAVRSRRGSASGTDANRLAHQRAKFLRRSIGKDMDSATFHANYNKYGTPGEGGWAAQEAGRRAGAVAGGLGIFGAATTAPFTLAGWAGGASAAGGAQDRAREGATQGMADQLQKFRSGNFMDRMSGAWNPNAMLEDLYSPENVGRSGVAHHYMYGPGQQEQIQAPGFMNYARELLFPFIPVLGTGGTMDQAIQSKALQQFQKSGSAQKMTAAAQLFLVKSAMGLGVGSAVSRVAKEVADEALNAAGKAVTKSKKVKLRAPGSAPATEPAMTTALAKTKQPTPQPMSGFGQRFNTARELFKDPKYALPAIFSTAALPATGAYFYGGRKSVRDGAYNAGYGGGAAMAAQQFANMGMLQRFAAAAFPDMAMNRLFDQYPELMAAYQKASERGVPAGMRKRPEVPPSAAVLR